MSTIYRVETLDGAGPYCEEVLSRLERVRYEACGPEPESPSIEEWRHWYRKELPLADIWRHPSPGIAWRMNLYNRRLGDFVDYGEWIIFGCPTVASLCAWFHGWGVHLSSLGFVVREYDTEVLWSMVHREANGLAQCVFDRRSAKIVATHDPAHFIY